VCPSKPIRPERQLINLRIGDVVGGVEAYDGTEESPRAEDAGGERVDAGGRGGVDLGGVDGCQVGLYGVGYGDGGDLRGSSGYGGSILGWGAYEEEPRGEPAFVLGEEGEHCGALERNGIRWHQLEIYAAQAIKNNCYEATYYL